MLRGLRFPPGWWSLDSCLVEGGVEAKVLRFFVGGWVASGRSCGIHSAGMPMYCGFSCCAGCDLVLTGEVAVGRRECVL